jgi:mannose-6-phosphate isomerase-like protein (cupin superfamily)
MVEQGTSTSRIDPDSPEAFFSLRRALGVSTFGINQILLRPGQRLRIHRHHRQEEVYLVLDGTLTVAVEGEETDLVKGELMRVAPGVRRQLINRGPGSVLLIALGADGEHEGRDGEAFTAWEETTGAPPQEVPLPDDLSSAERRS